MYLRAFPPSKQLLLCLSQDVALQNCAISCSTCYRCGDGSELAKRFALLPSFSVYITGLNESRDRSLPQTAGAGLVLGLHGHIVRKPPPYYPSSLNGVKTFPRQIKGAGMWEQVRDKATGFICSLSLTLNHNIHPAVGQARHRTTQTDIWSQKCFSVTWPGTSIWPVWPLKQKGCRLRLVSGLAAQGLMKLQSHDKISQLQAPNLF